MVELVALLGVLGSQEIIIILVIVLLLFGGKKIPELMRGVGRGVKEFKDGMNGSTETNTNKTTTEAKETSSDK